MRPLFSWGSLRLLMPWLTYALCLLTFGQSTRLWARPGQDPLPEATLEARVSPDLTQLEGRFSLPVQNGTSRPMTRLSLLLYPEALATPPAALNDINFRWLYPAAFSPASLTVSALRLEGLEGPAQLLPSPPRGQPVVSLTLTQPLQPGERAILSGQFVTTIPERFGGFGLFRDQISLEGAFSPLLLGQTDLDFDPQAPLPRLRWRVTLQVPTGYQAFLASQPVPPAPGVLTLEASAPPLVLQKPLPPLTIQGGTPLPTSPQAPAIPDLELRLLPSTRAHERARVTSVLQAWLTALRASPLAPMLAAPGVDRRPLVLQQVPLRDVFSLPVEEGIWVTDRLYRVMPAFRTFQDEELRWRVTEALLRRVLCDREGRDAGWVAEGLARALVTQLQQADGRSMDSMLGRFTAIPLIDRLLHNPTYAQGDTYARSRPRPDRFRTRLHSQVEGLPGGMVVFARLEKRLGEERWHQLLNAYVAQGLEGPPLRGLLAAEPGLPEGLPPAWLQPPEPRNYRVEGSSQVTGKDGQPQVLVDVARDPQAPPEPVSVEVVGWPTIKASSGLNLQVSRERAVVLWDGEGEKARLEVPFASRPRRITLDPELLLLEPTRADNESPQRYNWIIWDMLVWYNGSRQASGTDETARQEGHAGQAGSMLRQATGQPTASDSAPVEGDGFTSVLLNLRYKDTLEEHNVFDFTAFRLQESLGGTASYYRYFGQKRTVYRWEYEVHLGLSFERLRETFEVEQVNADSVHFASVPQALTLFGGWSFDNRLNPYTPIWGQALDITFQLGNGIGQDQRLAPFASISLHARRLFPFNALHGLAARAKVETFLLGDQIPVQNGFLLGGTGELRSLSPRAEVGESKLLFSLEDRHTLLPELDLNLLIFRLREVRGVGFVDVGMVGTRGFQGLHGENVRLCAGYGLRLIVDLFGLSPLLITVDAAVPLDEALRQRTQPPWEATRILIGSYQAF